MAKKHVLQGEARSLPDWVDRFAGHDQGAALHGALCDKRGMRKRGRSASTGPVLAHSCLTDAPLLTVCEAAARLAVSEKTIRRIIASGALDGVRIGRSVRIRLADVEALFSQK